MTFDEQAIRSVVAAFALCNRCGRCANVFATCSPRIASSRRPRSTTPPRWRGKGAVWPFAGL